MTAAQDMPHGATWRCHVSLLQEGCDVAAPTVIQFGFALATTTSAGRISFSLVR